MIRWVDSFLRERKVQLVIDGYTCQVRDIKMGVPQGSLISPILFIIYLSRVFNAIEAKIPIKALSFADNIDLIATRGSIKEIVETLEKVGKEAFQWGLGNNVSFKVDKTETVLFIR